MHDRRGNSWLILIGYCLCPAAPYWKKKPESALYAPGETVRLDCHAEGIPTPHIAWKINGVPFNGTNTHTYTHTPSIVIMINVAY